MDFLVAVTGDIDCASGPGIARSLTETMTKQGSVVLDLADVSFLDCAGLASLLTAHHWAAEHGVDFHLIRPAPAVSLLLALVGPTTLDASLAPTARSARLVDGPRSGTVP